MRTLECVNASCEMRGYQMSDAPDQYPDGKCPECKGEMVESTQNVIRGVAIRAETLIYTRTTPTPVVEIKKEIDEYRDYATECKEEKLMYGSVQGY